MLAGLPPAPSASLLLALIGAATSHAVVGARHARGGRRASASCMPSQPGDRAERRRAARRGRGDRLRCCSCARWAARSAARWSGRCWPRVSPRGSRPAASDIPLRLACCAARARPGRLDAAGRSWRRAALRQRVSPRLPDLRRPRRARFPRHPADARSAAEKLTRLLGRRASRRGTRTEALATPARRWDAERFWSRRSEQTADREIT